MSRKWNVVVFEGLENPVWPHIELVRHRIVKLSSQPLRDWGFNYSELIEFCEAWDDAFSEYVRELRHGGIDWRKYQFTTGPYFYQDEKTGLLKFYFCTQPGNHKPKETVFITQLHK